MSFGSYLKSLYDPGSKTLLICCIICGSTQEYLISDDEEEMDLPFEHEDGCLTEIEDQMN